MRPERRLRGRDFGESLSTDTLHSTHAQLSNYRNSSSRILQRPDKCGTIFPSVPTTPDCWSSPSFTRPPSSVNTVSWLCAESVFLKTTYIDVFSNLCQRWCFSDLFFFLALIALIQLFIYRTPQFTSFVFFCFCPNTLNYTQNTCKNSDTSRSDGTVLDEHQCVLHCHDSIIAGK